MPTPLTRWLRSAAIGDADRGIADYTELAIDHNAAYHSRELMRTATDWLQASGD